METATNLEEALAHMRWRVEPGRFALLGFAERPDAVDLALLAGERPAQVIREGGETTLLIADELADEAIARHAHVRAERDLAWIRFETAMGWELVGFLALVTGELAAAQIPIGAVCGFSRDHLFLAAQHLDAARATLTELLGPEAARRG